MHEHSGGERRGTSLIAMPVVTIQDGRKVGEITALLVRREEGTVAAVRIGNQIAPGQAVPYQSLRLVGVDVVLVDSAAALEPSLPTDEVRTLEDGVVGRAVLTASGERIGSISDFWVDTATGRVTAYRVHPEASFLTRLSHLMRHDTFEVPAEQVQALGVAALIVNDTVATDESAAPPSGVKVI